MRKNGLFVGLLLATFLLLTPAAHAGLMPFGGFDDLSLASESYYNGSDGAGGFISGDTWYTNSFTDTGSMTYWDGWAYSNTTDTTTPGMGNQYSANTGGGAGGSDNYGVAYVSSWGQKSQLYFGYSSGDYDQSVDGFYVTNNTYATQSMLNGDYFAKQFGSIYDAEGNVDGTNGEDWFKMTAYGLDGSYARTGDAVEFYLADYRFDDSADDYIVDEWTWMDLSGLGEISGLEFELSSSDVGGWGMNTPSYFAMDAVPIPGAVWLLGSGVLGLVGIRRKSGK